MDSTPVRARRNGRAAMALLAGVLAAQPLNSARAGDGGQPSSRGNVLDPAGEKLVRALEQMLRSLPQYAAPEVDEEGNIIIRRLDGDNQEPPSLPQPRAKDVPAQT